MENATLTKEVIESVVSDKYIGAQDFVWQDNGLSFRFNDIKDRNYMDNNDMLKGMISEQQIHITELQARLHQTELILNNIIKRMVEG